MRSLLLTLVLSIFSFSSNAQESDFDNIVAPSNGNCGNPLVYKASVTNVGIKPLINTALIIEVYNIFDIVDYLDTVPGPNINPNNTHQFDVIIPPGSLQFNGEYRTQFTFLAINDQNTNNQSPFFPLTLTFCSIGPEQAAQMMSEFIEQNINLGEHQVGYMYPDKIDANTCIQSLFTEEFDTIFATDIYFGFVVSDASSLFEQTCQYLIMNAQFGFTSVFDANWYPIINEIPWNPHPFGELQITEFELIPVAPPILEFPPELPSIDTNVCAILVSGFDANDTMQTTFNNDVDVFKEYLMTSKYGPKLSDDQITVLRQPVEFRIREEIKRLDIGYDKIYFYYWGHGSRDGKIAASTRSPNWMSYEELFDELYSTRASQFCLILDCCYSGKAVEAAENNIGTSLRDIEIMTGANEEKTGTASFYWEDNKWIAHPTMSRNFLFCANDQQADSNQNDSISFEEAFDWMIAQNPIVPGPGDTVRLNERSCPEKFVNDYNPIIYEDIWLNYVNGNYHAKDIDFSEIYLHPQLLQIGDPIRSFDRSFEFVMPFEGHFGWVNWEANASFEKEVTYGFINPITSEIQVFDAVPFWPVISDLRDYNPYHIDDLVFTGETSTTAEVPENIFEEIPEPAPVKDSICALLISGTDSKRPRYVERYQENVNMFKGNLMGEKFGPQLNEENILVQHGIGKDSILSILSSMKDQYKKVYFYYAGHGNRTNIACGASKSEWLMYRELLSALNEVNAEDYCIFLDNCYSGNLLCEQKRDQLIDQPNVEIYTSANKDKYSYGNYHIGGTTTGYSVFTFNFLRCFGDPAAEKNGDSQTSFKESFDWFVKQNPKMTSGEIIIDKQCPMHFVKKDLKKTGNDTGVDTAKDTDFSIQQRNRSISSYDLDVISYFDISNKQFEDAEILDISTNRHWQVTGDLDPDTDQVFDYIFQYDEGLDSLAEVAGIVGVVYKASTDSIWQFYYPTMYEMENNQVIAQDVTQTDAEFAIAKIDPKLTSISSSAERLDLRIFPNPALDRIHISAQVTELTMIDANGRIIKSYARADLNIGSEETSITLPHHILPGLYFLDINIGNHVVRKPLIKGY